MTPLHQKLNQLNLATMSLHLDQMLTDATVKNLSLAQTLEALVDRELEVRHQTQGHSHARYRHRRAIGRDRLRTN
jgi:hypothetical protein